MKTKWEELKQALIRDGRRAVEKFLGEKLSDDITSEELDQKLDAAWMMKHWSTLFHYYQKYGISLL